MPNVDLDGLLESLPHCQKADVYNHHTEDQRVMNVATVVQEFK
jgi:hypothetical protein